MARASVSIASSRTSSAAPCIIRSRQVAPPTLTRCARRLGPKEHLGVRRIVVFARQRPRAVFQSAAIAATAADPVTRSLSAAPRSATHGRGCRRVLELIPGDRFDYVGHRRPRSAWRVRSIASSTYPRRRPRRSGPLPIQYRHALATAIKWAAVAAVNRGNVLRVQGTQVSVSYRILDTARRNRCNRCIVASVASSRSIASSAPLQPISRALTAHSR